VRFLRRLLLGITICSVAIQCVALSPLGAISLYTDTDEALVNLRVTNRRWVDCTTLKAAVEDMFRLEGAKTEQERALAVWRWQRVLVDPRGCTCYEGAFGNERYVKDPHKLLTVFGSHHCDGMTRIMCGLWNASGRLGFKGFVPAAHHTQAELFYRDDDGIERFHMFDIRQNYFVWDRKGKRILSQAELGDDPIMGGAGPGWIHCAPSPPVQHSLARSLRLGEQIQLCWDSDGHFLRRKVSKKTKRYYEYEPGMLRPLSITNVAGQEIQTLDADTSLDTFTKSLYRLSSNAGASPPANGKASLHPRQAGKLAAFVYHLPMPYIVEDAEVDVTLIRGNAKDVCRMALSTDNGKTWHTFYEMTETGERRIKVNIGREACKEKRPSVSGFFNFLVKVEVQSNSGDIRSTGINALRVVVHRQLNKRTLPVLREGKNPITVTADSIAEGYALELTFRWREMDGEHEVVKEIRRFPYYFTISTGAIPSEVAQNGPVPNRAEKTPGRRKVEYLVRRMVSITMRVIPAENVRKEVTKPHLPPKELEGLIDIMGSLVVPPKLTTPLSNTVKELLSVIKHPKSRTDRIRALEALAALGTDNALKGLERLARKGNKRAILAISQTKDCDHAVEILSRLVDDLKGERQIVGIRALGLCRSQKATKKLLELFAKNRRHLFLATALRQNADSRAFDPILQYFKRVNLQKYNPIGWVYVQALAELDGKRALPILLEALPDANSDFTWHIANALGQIDDPAAIKPLLSKLEKTHPPGKWAIIEALGRLKARQATGKLRAMLHSASPETHFYVKRALKAMNNRTTP